MIDGILIVISYIEQAASRVLADLSGEPEVGEVVCYPDCGSDDYAHLHGKEADEVVQYPDHMYWDEWCDEDED